MMLTITRRIAQRYIINPSCFSRSYTLIAKSPRTFRPDGLNRLRTVVTAPTLGPQADPYTKLTNAFKSEQGDVLRVKISQQAADKLNKIKMDDKNSEQVLRVGVESGGCHGFQYLLSLKNADTIDMENDSIFERDGAQVVIDQTSLEILQDSTIDYTTELIGSQFKVVDSPYASSSCGCGTSFSFDPTKKQQPAKK